MRDWKKGVNHELDGDRQEPDMLDLAENVQLSQNGTIKPRPGLVEYDIQPTNTVVGGPYEYVKMSGTTAETWLVWCEDDSGTGKIYTNKDGGSNNIEVTGRTYDVDAKTHFEQVSNVVMITNGVDNLSYMGIDTQTITEYESLDTPSISSVTESGLTGTTVKYYYRVSAANLGETAGSVAVDEDVVKDHTLWNGTTEKVDITFPRVTGADRYVIYRGTEIGYEYYLDTLTDPGTGSDATYTDTGALFTNTNRLVPSNDSTAGPLVTRVTNIKGRPYMVGDKTSGQEGRIWFGGDSSEGALDFSISRGGGWVEPNKGGKDFPVKVIPFRDGLGNPTAVVLSKETNGRGKRYLLQPSTSQLGETVIDYMATSEDNGQAGTDSPDGVLLVDDALFYPSRDSFKTSTTKPQVQNIISTSGISDGISPKVQNLSSKYMDNAVGITNDRKLYWALPFASETNNQIWVLDLRQGGSWMLPWDISADWLTLYAENETGDTKFLLAQGDTFYEVDEDKLTEDHETSFTTNVGSGHIRLAENPRVFGSIIDVTFVILKPLGQINLSLTVNTEDGLIVLGDTVNTTTTQSVSGFGAFGWGDIGWGNIENNPPLEVKATLTRVDQLIEVDEEANWLTWGVNTTDAGVSYEVSEIIVRYVPVGFIEPDN